MQVGTGIVETARMLWSGFPGQQAGKPIKLLLRHKIQVCTAAQVALYGEEGQACVLDKEPVHGHEIFWLSALKRPQG